MDTEAPVFAGQIFAEMLAGMNMTKAYKRKCLWNIEKVKRRMGMDDRCGEDGEDNTARDCREGRLPPDQNNDRILRDISPPTSPRISALQTQEPQYP
jgi:hypothetical protein